MSPVTAEEEFLLALTTVQATYGTTSASEADLRDIVGIEESRVADACVIAEVLAARIAAQQLPASTHVPVLAAVPEDPSPSLPTPIPFPSSVPTSPLSVADLIDGMLSQEKRDVRTPSRH